MVTVIGRDGSRRELEPADGPLMKQLRAMKVGVIGLCNGNAACGTCHVYVAGAGGDSLPPPDEYELDMLETLRNRRVESRLSCQIHYRPGLDELELTVAPRG